MHAFTAHDNIPAPGQSARRLLKRTGLAVLLVAGLAACATGPKNPMTAQQIAALDITKVNVQVLPGAAISWGAAKEDFAESKGCPRPEPDSGNPGDEYNVAAATATNPDCD